MIGISFSTKPARVDAFTFKASRPPNPDHRDSNVRSDIRTGHDEFVSILLSDIIGTAYGTTSAETIVWWSGLDVLGLFAFEDGTKTAGGTQVYRTRANTRVP